MASYSHYLRDSLVPRLPSFFGGWGRAYLREPLQLDIATIYLRESLQLAVVST